MLKMTTSIVYLLLCFSSWAMATTTDLGNDTDAMALIRNVVCSQEYSMSCLRLDIVGAVERMGGGAEYQLLPGVYFSHRLNRTSPPGEILKDLTSKNHSKEVDSYISSRINDYLSSLTLSVKVLDSVTVNHARKLSEQILSHLMPANIGRGIVVTNKEMIEEFRTNQMEFNGGYELILNFIYQEVEPLGFSEDGKEKLKSKVSIFLKIKKKN